jgi:hypothetical protein
MVESTNLWLTQTLIEGVRLGYGYGMIVMMTWGFRMMTEAFVIMKRTFMMTA